MKVSENGQLSKASSLISSLIDQITRVHNFKGKWSLIAKKLADLQSQINDFNDFTGFSSTSLSVDLIHSASRTLTDAILLAEKCASVCLVDGKLRTQSDVDCILAKLDRHVRDADILIKSGVLQDSNGASGAGGSGGGDGEGVMVVVPTTSSKREAVRAVCRNLITRLQIGGFESKNSAMDSLIALIHEDDKNVLIAVAQGVVPVLVKLLDSSSYEVKEKAIFAISRVSMVESSKHVLVAEGLLLLNHLLRVLESGSGYAKEKACIVLQSLTFSKENARAIGSRGGISSLLEICQAGTPVSQAVAAEVLKNLAKFPEINENFIEENAVVVLLALASSGTTVAQENALGCLSNLVCEDERLKLAVVRDGGIECLKNFWDGAVTTRSFEAAVDLLRTLASCPQLAEVLVSDGFIARLVALLNSAVLSVRLAAARAVYELGFSTNTRKEMGECGCITYLIHMLDNKAVEEKEAAAKALSNLMQYVANIRLFRKDERGVASTAQLLDPLVQNLDKKHPVSILSLVAHSKKCRKQMVAAGACVHLQKLAEMNVEGAKKLHESLSSGKLWGVFSRA